MTGRGPEQGCGVSPPRGGGRLPRGPGLQPHPPESSVSHIVSCWLLGFGVGFCLPSPPHANPPSRPHCLGNALQSPHKGKLHGEAGPTRRQGKSFYGNTDITRLSRLQSQAGPERRCLGVHAVAPRRRVTQGLCGMLAGPSLALPLTCQVTLSKPQGLGLSLLIYK